MTQNLDKFKPESFDLEKFSAFRIYDIQKADYDRILSLSNPPPFIVLEETYKIGKLIEDEEAYCLKIFMTYAEVAEKIIDYNSGIVTIKIRYYNGAEVREDVFSSEILTKNGVKELLNKGIRFDEMDSSLVIEYFLKSESNAKVVYGYTKNGWDCKNDNLVFFGNELLGDKKLKSKYLYQGDFDLTPTGSLSVWSDMIKSEVIGNKPLELVLCSSFASVLLALLNKSNDFGSIIVNLANTSSKGKTTAAMLAASVFSNPLLNRGTAISYNATDNSLQEHVAKCNGFSVVIDEAAVSNDKSLQKTLYSIAIGRSKMRLNGDGLQKPVKEFSSVIFSTAEFNFVNDDSMEGLKARVFEITDTLTKSAKSSDKIKQTVIKNYAVAGNVFIEYLIDKGKENIEADYEQTKQQLIEKYKGLQSCSENNSLTERILSKLSIFLQAAKYSNEVFDFSVNIEAMTSYIFALVNRIVDIPSPEEELLTIVYEDVLNNFKRYKCSFSSVTNTFERKTLEEINLSVFRNGCIGLIRNSNEDGFFDVCVAQHHFKKLMQKHKIADYRKRLKNLRADGRLVAQKDRQISKVCIIEDMPKMTVYIFRFLIEKEDKIKNTYIEGYNQIETISNNNIEEEIDFSTYFDNVS